MTIAQFSPASPAHGLIDRRRIGTDRRQMRGVQQQANEDRRRTQPDRRNAFALAQAITDLSHLEPRCVDAELEGARAEAVWSRAMAEYEIAETDWSEARATLAKARAAVARAHAKVEALKRG